MYDNTTIESFGHWLCNIVLADKMLPMFFYNVVGMLYFSSRKHKVEKKVLLILNKFDKLQRWLMNIVNSTQYNFTQK